MNDPCECGPCTYTLEDITALGKRLVACKGFRPMRGMLDLQGRTWDTSLLWRWNNDVDVPDLRDPATLGCVLALVREAWSAPNGHMRFDGICGSEPRGWSYCWATSDGQFGGGLRYRPTEVEMLVAALEAAP